MHISKYFKVTYCTCMYNLHAVRILLLEMFCAFYAVCVNYSPFEIEVLKVFKVHVCHATWVFYNYLIFFSIIIIIIIVRYSSLAIVMAVMEDSTQGYQ